jgi:putative transposase
VAGARLAARQKKVARLKARLAFVDESGHLMTPFVAKTWGLRGRTPVLPHRARHHQKVSVVGAVTLSPGRRRCGLYFNTHLNASVNDRKVAAFLRDLLRHLRRGHVVVVWDRINSHRSKFLRDWVARRPRLHVELLPPYAPELNPVEWFWEDADCHELANHGIDDLLELRRRVQRHGRRTRNRQHKLRGFIRSAHLPMRL